MTTTEHSTTNKTRFKEGKAGMWFFFVIAVVFVAAVNFVNVMSHDDGSGHGAEAHNTSATHEAASHDANAHQTPAHEAATESHSDTEHTATEAAH